MEEAEKVMACEFAICMFSVSHHARQLVFRSLTRNFSASARCFLEVKRIVYLDNIPFNTNVLQLKETAEPFGLVTKINIPNNSQGRPAGFANLEFAHEKDALDFYNAVEEHGLELDTTVEHVRDGLGTFADIIVRVTFASSSGGQDSQGPLIYVQFPSESIAGEVIAAAKSHLIFINGRRPWVHYATKRKSSLSFEELNSTRTVYFGGLPKGTTQDELIKVLAPFGKIERVSIPGGYDETIAFVDFALREAAVRVIEAGNQQQIVIKGHKVWTDFAKGLPQGPREIIKTDKLHLSGFEGTEGDVKSIFAKHRDKVQGISFTSAETKKHNASITFRSVMAADRALREILRKKSRIKKKHGAFTLHFAESAEF
ncbi:rna recognition motif protein [Moniliophthora roreri MCA 2997]|uniref:Rna recognition motif protein n=1 Tax=Moniliophthora roreri (strain MCA 2997) TaxID=1381753 RepID=V2XCJ8_MONRO|nr:rna recognition motif protein [Moniliophthora roreri MCA 2997]